MGFEWLTHPNNLSRVGGEKCDGLGEKVAPSPGLGSFGEEGCAWVILEKEGYIWEMGPNPCSTEPGRGAMPPHGLHDVGFSPSEGTEPSVPAGRGADSVPWGN